MMIYGIFIMIKISNKEHWLIEQAKDNPNQIALQDEKNTITYLQLLTYSTRAAQHFKTIGITKETHTSIISKNSIDFTIAINALWLLGAIPIPLNIRLKPNEIEKLISHSESKILLNLNNVISASEIQFKNIYSISLTDFNDNDSSLQKVKFQRDNIALMMYSSGSTGSPKCVQLTFYNLFESTKSLRSIINTEQNDIWLASLPIYHIGGFSIISRSIIFGNTIAFSKSTSSKNIINSLLKYKPTYFSIVPTTLKQILEEKIAPWKELKTIFIGGGPLNTKDVLKAIEIGFPLVEVYGSTETASMVTSVTEQSLFKKSYCVGKPIQGSTITIVDKNRKALGKMEVGEIVISSKSVANSYYNYSNDKSSKLLNQKFYSNDFGYIDKDGYLFLIGRKDDMIISGGENINLNEIEESVKTLDIIKDCTTLKVTDEKWGESYVLFVVPKVKSEKEKIGNKIRENIPNFKQPKSIRFVDSLCRNEISKIDKKKLPNFLN